jgi:hypothetical protein
LGDGLRLLAADTLRQGIALYRELVLQDGPTDAAMLVAAFAVLGESARTLALLESAFGGLAAGLGFLAARRLGAGRWAWWVPLGVLALGPFAPRQVLVLAAALLGASWLETGSRSSARGFAVGLLLGIAALSGLDGLAWSLAVGGVLAWELRKNTEGHRLRRLAVPGLGFALPWILALSAGAMQMALPAAFDQVVLGGLARFGEQLRAVPGLGYLKTAVGAEGARSPFTALHTGEVLDAFLPGQAGLRAWSFRLRAVLIPLVLFLAWRRSDWRAQPARILLVLASLPALTLLLRGDPLAVDRAWLGAVFLLPALLGTWRGSWMRRCALVLLPLLLFGLSALEMGWLATHRHRPGLQWWERPRAGIALAEAQVEQVEALFTALGGAGEPLLIWPASPGLHFLMERPPALPQTVLLPGWVRNPERLAEELRAARPIHILLGLTWYYGGRQIEELAPGVWDQLRRDYWVIGNVSQGGLRMRVLELIPPEGKIEELPLRKRLPEIEQTVGNGTGPAMRPGLEVGQSFEVGNEDFEGIAVRWHTEREDLVVPVRVRVWMFREGHWGNLVRFDDLDLSIPGDLHRSYIRFGPIAETAGTRLTVTLEVREEIDYDLRLVWHRREGDNSAVDFYPEGTATIEMDPVNADLYFLTW